MSRNRFQRRAAVPVFLALVWVALVVPIVVVASLPTSTEVQALLGVIAVVLVAILKPFTRTSIVARLSLLAVASVLVLRYWIWRLLESLPSPEQPVSLAAALLLFAIETYAIAVFMLTAFINADPKDRPLPRRVKAEELPTVDILVPSYNEPTDMLSVTLSAAKHIHYPREKLRVVLCDDGGTDQRCNHPDPQIAEASKTRRAELQKLCRELGVLYSTRARNEHAKAGNMSAALSRLDGDLVVVFDADHVPSRDFLARTVGYFVENPRLFLVQTPHFFLNSDPVERNLGLAPSCPAENEMFYSDIHRGLDRWQGAFFCGSAAILRRTALNEAGGFSGETITEDAETALDIHAKGWESLYVNRAMIAGLQAETFASFIQQRGRWATGMVQMLLLKNPLFRPGLKPAQRLCYINSMSFWLFPLVRLSFLIIPALLPLLRAGDLRGLGRRGSGLRDLLSGGQFHGAERAFRPREMAVDLGGLRGRAGALPRHPDLQDHSAAPRGQVRRNREGRDAGGGFHLADLPAASAPVPPDGRGCGRGGHPLGPPSRAIGA